MAWSVDVECVEARRGTGWNTNERARISAPKTADRRGLRGRG
jgi:hypothetical protein